MQSHRSTHSRLREEAPILAILAFGAVLVAFLADPTLQSDPREWLATARRVVETGETGPQHRNILFAYILALPLRLGVNPVGFGVAFSGASLLVATFLVYRMASWHVSRGVAAFTALLFLVSYPMLRYGSQVFTDVPTLACLAATVFFHLRFLRHGRLRDLWLGYFAAGLALSLRYAAAFWLPAHAYFLCSTRRHWRAHLLGFVFAFVPYLPQLHYNLTYLSGPLALSYADRHPVLGWSFFRRELGSGVEYQALHYLRYLFLDFRGLFVLLVPLCVAGLVVSTRRLRRAESRYWILFVLGSLVLLSFYAFFSNRYAIPVLVPCFLWTALGLDRALAALAPHRRLRVSFLTALFLTAYGMFEISFQVIQSSRAIHVVRSRLVAEAARIIEAPSVVFAPVAMRGALKAALPSGARVAGDDEVTPELLSSSPEPLMYAVWASRQWASEGSGRQLSIEAVRDRTEPIHTARSARVVELALYRLLRATDRAEKIPAEEWEISRIASARAHADSTTSR